MKRKTETMMNEKQTKALSFLGGLIFFTVVAGVVISKDEGIRNEIQEQTKALLKTSKKALQQIQFAVSKIGKLTGDLKNDKLNSNIDSQQTEKIVDNYDSQWEQI